ncbi:MAG TPA: lytic transglycosylase domain-containing protein, partial [Pyrinomonadaceae bacterium]|nr:lytic transglycosylase domain-containing protein [Pyrinomonadaceae bacterium]
MRKTFPRLSALAPLALFTAIIFSPSVFAQTPTTGSGARYIPNEIEKADATVTKVIDRAEVHFKQGEINLRDNRREQARDEFDKAVDTILNSGMDVRANQKLQTYYLELVERIYRLEVPQQRNNTPSSLINQQVAKNVPASMTDNDQDGQQDEQVVGFKDQKFEPSPLDELAKLILTPAEINVDPADLEGLELAKNQIDFKFNVNPLIQGFINYYQGRGRVTMETGMRRSGQFMQMARKIFREEGVPEDIVWLGQVESGWRAKAYSSAAASGLWQFIPSTGRNFGLRQTAWVDERNGFEKATRASAKYLKFLANRYNGNWELAIAAYNTGEGNIDRAIQRAGRADFWTIYPYIAQETRNYVPNILATILITKDPKRYGFGNIRPDAPLSYDTIQVQNATSLQLIAAATGTTVDYLRYLNPELRKDVTPRGEAFAVRIPGGKAAQAVAYIKNVPADRRDQAPRLTQAVVGIYERPNTSAPAARNLMIVKA